MENNKTFGRFLISKRMEHEMSARQLAIALDIQPYISATLKKTADRFLTIFLKNFPHFSV